YVQTGIDLGGTCPSGGRNTWDIAQWVIDNGTSTEMNAPYGSRSASLFNCTADWTIPAVQDAQVLKINTRTWIASVHPTSGKWHLNDADIDDVKTVLREQERVVPFRTQVDFDFSDPDYANGEAWTYDGNNRGGHAMCIVGYNDSIGATGAFKVRNSWGLNWGDDGYCWISYESMKHSTAGVYAFYITADCDVDVISRFCPTTPFLFPVCGIRIPILYPEYILLTWEPVVNAVRYVIYRDLQVEPWGFVTAPEPGMPVEFMDEQVGDYLAHVYWVVATDGNVDSEFSSPVVGWLLNGT
ncbi:C1 family peptidase, partial [bacterium]|nr:C1 family peptidase [bacterium]